MNMINSKYASVHDVQKIQYLIEEGSNLNKMLKSFIKHMF